MRSSAGKKDDKYGGKRQIRMGLDSHREKIPISYNLAEAE